ncbi:carbamoyl phosphate synthase small subunit [Chungangia koreensis]|uniref:Carbamoyl phosphate synthase small chain n=1 Tax=Chungangia koreensis TaxID=752657 RepID=A0ABV8X036_9LACT
MKKRYLVLENGSIYEGVAFGAEKASVGEVVFNTGMTGYQEVLSDPSYCGQLVTMTYPLIGNYGINRDDFESIEPAAKGLVIRELAEEPSNFRSERSLNEFLIQKGIPGISEVDTRRLTREIRNYGTIKGYFTEAGADLDKATVLAELSSTDLPTDQVASVSIKRSYASPGRGKRVVLVDFGMKHGILRELNRRDCDVVVVPYNATANEVLSLNPDGIMLSNGPGDPKDVPEAIELLNGVLGKVPVFGICLGHQLLALACGGNTFKLKFGHRGGNHPVKSLVTGKTFLTSQNHGYSVDPESLKGTDLEVTEIALNDGTVEGLRHKKHLAFSAQYHPEASPGPEDSNFLFDDFIDMIQQQSRKEIHHA